MAGDPPEHRSWVVVDFGPDCAGLAMIAARAAVVLIAAGVGLAAIVLELIAIREAGNADGDPSGALLPRTDGGTAGAAVRRIRAQVDTR